MEKKIAGQCDKRSKSQSERDGDAIKAAVKYRSLWMLGQGRAWCISMPIPKYLAQRNPLLCKIYLLFHTTRKKLIRKEMEEVTQT